MAVARSGAASVLLSNGNVLITGGDSPTGTLNTAEVMSNAGIFSSAAQLQSPRSGHTATTLQDGRVLITGGVTTTGGGATNSAELYDPSANSWHSSAAACSPPARDTPHRPAGWTSTVGRRLQPGGPFPRSKFLMLPLTVSAALEY
jgi:hypothetical protein